jgi:hypothetical protein
MFVASDKCMFDLVANKLTSMILIMDPSTENKRRVTAAAYLVAQESFPLVDIVFIDVVVPLVKV